MKYRDILGYSKSKKKVIKEQPKSKKTILDGIKRELNESSVAIGFQTSKDNPPLKTKKRITEMTAAQEHYKYIKLITKAEENMHKHIQEYKYFLQDQDLDREAKEIGSKYITMIGKFTHYLKTKWVRMVRKMI